MKYPILYRDFAYRQQGSTGILDAEFWQRYRQAPFYEYGFVRREINTKSVYSPPLLLPQALTLRILGRVLDLPALPVFYACRFASLLSYLLLVWLAIRAIPFGKWILLVLAVTPMALFQAATISPDAISNGIGFLFIAGCLKTSRSEKIGWKEFGCLTFLFFLLFLAKLNLIPLLLLPFLLLPPSRFSRKGIYVFLLAATLLLFLMEVVGWYIIASARSDAIITNDASPVAQLGYLAGHPFTFLQIIVKDLIANGWIYFQGWINGYGYYYWTPPLVVSFLFLLGLAAALLSESTLVLVDRKSRIVFILVFAAGYIATIASLYLTFTSVGSDAVFGVQGRYFIPLAPLLFLGLGGISWIRKFTISSSKWTIAFLAAALSLNVLGIFLTFHIPCGSTYYQTGYCYQPLFRDFPNETRPSPPVSNEVTIAQGLEVACDGFAELRLLIVSYLPADKGSTHFILEKAKSSQALLDLSIANDQIAAGDWYPLRFEPDWHSAGEKYTLIVSSQEISAGQGIQFLYTPQSEFNLGDLLENGVPLKEDLVLQYGCATGLRKIWPTGQVLKP